MPGDVLGTREYGERFASAVVERRRAGVRRPVPPREVVGADGLPCWRNFAASAPAWRPDAPREPLSGDRHPRRQGGAPAPGALRGGDGVRRRPAGGRAGVGRGRRAAPARGGPGRRARGRAASALEHVARIAPQLGVPVQCGGGLRSLDVDRRARCGGADRVVLGTAAFTETGLLDAALARRATRGRGRGRARRAGGHGGLDADGEPDDPPRRMAELARRAWARSSTPTSTATGCWRAPDLDEVPRVAAAVAAERLVSRGGSARSSDLERAARARRRTLAGVIVGKALYERRFTVAEAAALLADGDDGADALQARHPLPGRRRRPRRQGHPLRRHPRRRRPRRAGRALRRARAPTSSCSSTSPPRTRSATRWSSWRAPPADDVFVPFTIGGGIRAVDDAQAVLDAGRRQGRR